MTQSLLFLLAFATSALCLAGVVGGGPLSHQELHTPDLNGPVTPANTIFRLENEAMEQWRQGNPMRWVEISSDDVIYIDPALATPVVGTKAYREYLTPLLGKVRYDASEFVEPRVALAGDLAVLTYNYHALRRDAGGKMARVSNWNTTQIYVHRDGVWKILHSHWSYIGHRQPAEIEVPLTITAKPAQLPPTANEILTLEKAAMKRWGQGDPDGFLALSVPQVTYFDPLLPSRLTGIASLSEFYKGMRGKGGEPPRWITLIRASRLRAMRPCSPTASSGEGSTPTARSRPALPGTAPRSINAELGTGASSTPIGR